MIGFIYILFFAIIIIAILFLICYEKFNRNNIFEENEQTKYHEDEEDSNIKI